LAHPCGWISFVRYEHLLPTLRGWDPGALDLARDIAERFPAPLYYDTTTRLLVDLNRSVGTRDLHSEATRHLPLAERRTILERYYHPHRRKTEGAVGAAVDGGARSSMWPRTASPRRLNGQIRTADIGLLYDPARAARSPSRPHG
jgi:predicted N-formylglutamate amidohydrolase